MQLRIILIIFYFSHIHSVIAQTTDELDRKIEKARQVLLDGKTADYLKTMDEVIVSSSKIKYSYGIASGYYGKSYVAFNSRDFSESIQFAKLAELENNGHNHWLLKSRICHILGLNHINLGLDDEALKYYKKMLFYAHNITDEKQSVFYENIAYNDIASVFKVQKKNSDSSSFYLKKIYTSLTNFSHKNAEMDVLLAKATLGLGIASKIQGNKDSLEYYFKKSLQQTPKKIPLNNDNVNVYNHLTVIYNAQGRFEDAKETNDILLKKAKKLHSIDLLNDAYKYKYILSDKTENPKNKNIRLREYVIINDSLNSIDNKNVKKAYRNIIEEKDKVIIKNSIYSRYLILIIISTVLIVFLLLYYLNKQFKERRLVLNEKQTEISELQEKVNEAFDEIVHLAKSHSPTFLSRFREVYPEFYQKIIFIFPTIQNSELELCAYIYLNFATKEIANFIFVTPKTIQMRKYRIRKKLNIPTDEDIYVWMKNL